VVSGSAYKYYFILFIFGAVAQNLGYDIGFPTFEFSPVRNSISSVYVNMTNFCSSVFQTVKLYLYPADAAINPLIPEFTNNINTGQAFTILDKQQFNEFMNNIRNNAAASNGSATPTGSDTNSTPRVPGSPASSVSSVLSEVESLSEQDKYLLPKSNPNLFTEGKIDLEPLQILTNSLGADNSQDLMEFSPLPPVSSWGSGPNFQPGIIDLPFNPWSFCSSYRGSYKIFSIFTDQGSSPRNR